MGYKKLDPTKLITPTVELPDPSKWNRGFSVRRGPKMPGRITIARPETAEFLAEAFIPEGSKDKVIIEAYPGPGQLTRSLLRLPRERIKKIILLEPVEGFAEWLRPLVDIDDRVVVVQEDPFNWETYSKITAAGHIADVPVVDWNAGLHPSLHFIQHLPSAVIGEQLLSQYVRLIPDRMWLFKYGRVPLDLITTARMWQRVAATEKETLQRCKIGVMAQATADISLPLPPRRMEPYDLHFWPKSSSKKEKYNTALEARSAGNPHLALRLTPLQNPLITPGELDYWDYVTRKLFISKATPVSKSITNLGPGASSLLKTLTDPNLPLDQQLDIKKTPRVLSVHDWKLIVEAFERWPFRPDNLSIDVDFIPSGKEARK